MNDTSASASGDSLRFPEEEVEPDTEWIEIGNEFATVLARRVRTRNGSRLQIQSPRRELSVFLDATLLDALTWQTAESMSLLLETPLEPFARRTYD